MKFLTLPTLLVGVLFSFVVVVPFLPVTRAPGSQFKLEARIQASGSGFTQLYFDTGTGFREEFSSRIALATGAAPVLYRFNFPPGRYRALRFDPVNFEGTVIVDSVRLVSRTGRLVHAFAASEFKAGNQIASHRAEGGRLEITTEPGASDPQFYVEFSPPLDVYTTLTQRIAEWLMHAGTVFLVLAALGCAVDRVRRIRHAAVKAIDWIGTRPVRAVAIVAAAAVIASSYPLVFLGKSLVSPNLGTSLLYEELPTLPGYSSTTTFDVKGSDIGAIMWQHIPLSMLQHEALFRDGELPLFNRYNSAGTPHLDQGQSMFGDPLHFFVVAANGAAWAWDLKYIVARWLFAAGLGLLALAVARHLPSALIVSLAAPFVGFFLFRLNHPAYFSLCYAPWVLYCWLRFIEAPGIRAAAAWSAGLILADWTLLNSGTVKEAYMLLLTMNFSGACMLAFANIPWRSRLLRLAGAAWTGLIFLLLSAPVWLTFLDTLKSSYTAYNAVSAFQIQPGLLLGAFDELFYRHLSIESRVFNPSVNFLILLGVLYFAATFRTHFANRPALAIAASSLVPLALAFGLIPAAWIVKVPFLANVAHIDNSFTCPLIVLWSVLAGVGFKAAYDRLGTREGRGDLIIAGAFLFALVFAWIGSRQAIHRPIYTVGTPLSFLTAAIPVPGFIWASLAAMLAASALLAATARRVLSRGRLTPASGLLIALCMLTFLWRTGLHAQTAGFDDFTAQPTTRVDFHAPSPAVGIMQAGQRTEPSRGVGFNGNFFPGWTGVYSLEGINGPEALVNPFFRELTGLGPIERIWDWRLYVSLDTLAASRPLLDALNVRYYVDLHSKPAAYKPMLNLVSTGDLDVYESPAVWPRAFFTDRLGLYEKTGDLLRLIAQGDGRPFATMQAQDAAIAPALSRDLRGRTVIPATDYKLTSNTTRFSVRATGPGVVALTEVLWPGDFRATINGKDSPVLRINHAFKGVVIPSAGDYELSFRYLPRRLPLALGLAALGLALCAASGFAACRRDASTIGERAAPIP